MRTRSVAGGLARCLVGVVLAITAGAVMPLVVGADTGISITGGDPGFAPDSAGVNPGDTVTWTNRDGTAAHNAFCGQACPDQFGGRLLHSGESESFTFKYSGTYNYTCSAHPNMHGTITVSGNVQPPNSGSGTAPGAGPSSAPTSAGQAASGGGSTAPGSTSGGGNTATPAQGSASAGQGSPAPTSEQIVHDYLAKAKLPAPHVTLIAHTTPDWVVVASAAALVLAAILFGLSWFGVPRLARLGRGSK